MQLSRGEFLAGVGAAVTFRNDTVSLLEKLAHETDRDPVSAAQDEHYWSGVRRTFEVEDHFLFLNHGGACPSPRTVQDAMAKRIRHANHAPSYYLFRDYDPAIEGVRKRIGKLFGCDPEEIAVTPNASQGLFTGILGLHVKEGDVMLNTEQDYPRVQTALHQRERRDRVKIAEASVPADAKTPAELMGNILERLKEKPRFLVFPRVSFLNGTLFPAEAICAEARRNGVVTLIDGAHSIGQVPDTAASLGCDMFACSLHKWLLGPTGTGFLYVNKETISQAWPLQAADPGLDNNIRKFEQFGTRPTGILLSLNEALDAHEAIGTERKAARLQYLRHHWTSQLQDDPRFAFHTVLDPAVSRCITTVEIKGIDSPSLAAWLLKKHRIFVTNVDRGPIKGIRVTAQIFVRPNELDRLVVALREAATLGIGLS